MVSGSVTPDTITDHAITQPELPEPEGKVPVSSFNHQGSSGDQPVLCQ